MGTNPHDIVDPMRAPNGLRRRTENPFIRGRGQHHGKSIACDPAAHRMDRQDLLQAFCDGNDEFVTAHNSMMGRNVLQPVQLDKRESGPVFIAPLSKREIQKLQRLTVI
jgi:hypothetical protein